MGIFSRGSSSDSSSDSSGAVPHGDEPGASTTQFDDGEGTVGLGDRLGGGAPDTNQGKAEPMPPTPGHGDPVGTAPHTDPPEVPELGDMIAGRAMSQVASPTVLGTTQTVLGATLDDGSRHGGHPGTVPAEDRPQTGASSSTGRGAGPEMPESQSTGTAHRAPGLQGETPDGESIESDTVAGAARMAPGGAPDRTAPPVDFPGDAQGV
ncbi:MAG: hypothetical protein JWM64_2620, partial [Frankiales bacterium]|nr:hypothetical protein [Frankiales bacterium]